MSKKTDNLIKVELEKLEAKVSEFQTYLELNSITSYSNSTLRMDEDDDHTRDAKDKLHKEIVIQIKMQDALFTWLPLLEKLRSVNEATLNVRGDGEINLLFKNKKNDNQ